MTSIHIGAIRLLRMATVIMELLVYQMISCDSPVPLDSLEEGDLVISITSYFNQVVADYKGEWFEIYNRTDNDVCIYGLEVEGGVGTGFVVEGQGAQDSQQVAMVFWLPVWLQQTVIVEDVLEQYSVNEMRLYMAGTIEMYTPTGVLLDMVDYDSTSTHPSELRCIYIYRCFGRR